jgi:hypothetical protein
MFDNYYCITEVDELAEVVDEETTITRMKTDGWLIEDIGDSLQSCSYLRCETNTLRFPS